MIICHRVLAGYGCQRVRFISLPTIPIARSLLNTRSLFPTGFHHNFSQTTPLKVVESSEQVLHQFKKTLQTPTATCSHDDILRNGSSWTGQSVRIYGYLGSRRDANQKLTFADLRSPCLTKILQIITSAGNLDGEKSLAYVTIRNLPEHTPVLVEGKIQIRKAPKSTSKIEPPSSRGETASVDSVEVKAEKVTVLNTFPADLIMNIDTTLPPEQRHLQIRNDADLRNALLFRGRVSRFLREHMASQYGFEEVETPLLFKSTPEGAREFLVPTRQPGLAYALPQSPQQYKQILMASGITRYMQFARCFRDEDLRADRQPEFTQLDVEMAFAGGWEVMEVIESTIKATWNEMLGVTDLPSNFPRMTYEEAMSRYGSDKPDLRFGSEIQRIEYMIPVDLVTKIGPLALPVVETFKISISDDPQKTKDFIDKFMRSPKALAFNQNPDGQPGIFIFDSTKPLQGLQPFGFEAAEQLEELLELQDGDLVVLQAREDKPLSGGSTATGNLRLALHRAAVNQGFAPKPDGFAFVWIIDFPLFSPSNDMDPGQGGDAGLVSTHHPFTAPKTAEDVDLLLSDPLSVKADHYDLVVNGVELGGGSRRIHIADMQELIMKRVLGMSGERIKDFEHLLDVLKAGCPPHAGIALGFDRMIAVMLGKTSVRDVIAFPKSGRGEDLLVRSPSEMTDSQLDTYHIRRK